MSQAEEFIKTRYRILTKVDSLNQEVVENTRDKDRAKNWIPKLATFGDSLLFSWNTSHMTTTHEEIIGFVSLWAQYSLIAGLSEGLLLRGAISLSGYVTDGEATFVGPAISEVARWYEEPQLIGVVFTPDTEVSD